MNSNTLILGACGQIGTELTAKLRAVNGVDSVIASDIRQSDAEEFKSGVFEIIDATNYEAIKTCVEKHNVDTIYLLAAMLSANAEKNPMFAWQLNMSSLFHVLNLAKEGVIKKVFWPSSIAVFGPTTPQGSVEQHTIMEPTTVYGISKQVGERWCEYYHNNYGVDVRSLRYPGIISWKTLPGGGTTDYAVDIYHQAISQGTYDCFLSKDTKLPMIFMEDALKATLDLMNAPAENLSIRSSYNLGAMSFTPSEIATEIKKHIPDFTITYSPDFRQKIADTWPDAIDDSLARKDWNWSPEFDLVATTNEMLLQLQSAIV